MQNPVEHAPEFLTHIHKKLENQLHLIWSQINYYEDLESSSFALTDYIKQSSEITDKSDHEKQSENQLVSTADIFRIVLSKLKIKKTH